MRILVTGADLDTFVQDQCDALEKEGIEVIKYQIKKKGFWGYITEAMNIRRSINRYHPDIIHAHYGLSGLCANLQRQVPVVTTYHGSDIHSGGWPLKLSRIAMRWSAYNIFVSSKLLEMSGYKKKNACVQSCGLDLDVIKVFPRIQARKELGIDAEERIGLFSGSFDNYIKNYPLAKAAIEKVKDVRLMELKGYSRKEVNLLMNASDFLLTTSYRESGPLVVKEAMACGTPVVSVDVGDVKEIVGDTEGCYIAEPDADDIARKIRLALDYKGKTNGRQRIINLGLDNKAISKKLLKIYQEII